MSEDLSDFFNEFIKKFSFWVEKLEFSRYFSLFIFALVKRSLKFLLVFTCNAFVVKFQRIWVGLKFKDYFVQISTMIDIVLINRVKIVSRIAIVFELVMKCLWLFFQLQVPLSNFIVFRNCGNLVEIDLWVIFYFCR